MAGAGTGTHTEATRDPERPLETAALGQERLLALYRISRELLNERAPGAVVERILSAAVEALVPERACLLALAADGSPRPLASRGIELGPEPDRWPISLSVVRHVIESGLAVLASDIRGDARRKAVANIIDFMSIGDLRDRHVESLSKGLKQRVSTQSISAVNTHTGTFTHSIQTCNLCFTVYVAIYASHCIMLGWLDRDKFFNRV